MVLDKSLFEVNWEEVLEEKCKKYDKLNKIVKSHTGRTKKL